MIQFNRLSGCLCLALSCLFTAGKPNALHAAVPTIFWTGASNQLWNVPQNWSPARVPLASDHVEIASNAPALQLNADATVANLTLGGGVSTQALVVNNRTLTLTGESFVQPGGLLVFSNGTVNAGLALRISGAMEWSEGTITGTVEVESGGGLTFAGTSDKQLWDHTTVRNSGEMRWLGGRIAARRYNGPAFLVNNSNGVFRVIGTGDVFASYNGYEDYAFSNRLGGVVRGESSGIARFVGTRLFNEGTLEMSGGSIQMDLNSTFATGARVIGHGLVAVGGTLSSVGELFVENGSLELRTGTFNPQNLTLHTPNGGRVDWLGGPISGAMTIAPGAEMRASGTADKQLWDHATITNAGRFVWQAGRVTARCYDGPAHFINASNGVFELSGDGNVVGRYNGYHQFTWRNDAGSLLHKTAGTSNRIENIVFELNSELRASTGRIDLDSTTTTGTDARITGSGEVRQVGRTFTITDALPIVSARLIHEAADVIASGTNAIVSTSAGGLYQWNGGWLSGQLRLAASSQARFGGGTKTFADHAQFINDGTVIWTGGNIAGDCYNGPAMLRNRAGGLFSAEGAAAMVRNNTYHPAVFILEAGGEMRKTVATEITSSWTLQNHGVATVLSGGWRWTGGGTSSGVFSNLAAGTFSFGGGTHTLQNGTRLNGSGKFRADGGTITANGIVNFAGLGSPAVFELVNGATINGSQFIVGGTFIWSNGWVAGLFTIDGPGVLTAAGPDAKYFGDHTYFENRGIVNWTGGGSFSGQCYNGAASIWNGSNAVFQLSGDGVPFTRANSYHEFRFTNSPGAQFRKTGPGVVTIQSLWPRLWGDVRVDAGSMFFNAPSLFRDGLRFKGSGLVAQTGNDITLQGTLTLDGTRYEHRAGSFWMEAPGGILRTLNNGLFDWQGSWISGVFAVTNGAQMRLSTSATKSLGDHSELQNHGSITWTEGRLDAHAYNGSATIRNQAAGRFSVTTNVTLARNSTYHEPQFINHGVLALAHTNALLSGDAWHFTQTGSGAIETTLGGTAPGVSMGQANWNRAVTVSGSVRAVFANGFVPGAGSRFTYLSASGLNGVLVAGALPTLPPELAWTFDQNATTASLVIESNAPCAPRPDGLITWLPAEDSAVDIEGQHSGLLVGGLDFLPGKVGRAFRFDGANDSVDLGSWFDLQVFSFSLWVKEGDWQQSYADIFDNNHTGYRSFVFQYANTGHRYGFGIHPMGSIEVDLTPGVWHHLAITREPGYILRLYRDGELMGSITNASPATYDGSQSLRLGSWGAGGRHWNGQLDEFAIFNRALTLEEVLAIRNAGISGLCRDDLPNPVCLPRPHGLVGWWTGDNTTNDLAISGGATLLNGAAFAPGYSAQGFNLDGGDDLISIGDVPALAGATELTLAAWVLKSPGSDNIGGIIGKWDTGPNVAENSFLLFNGEDDYLNRGGLALQFTDDSAALLKGVSTLPVGNWTHIAATWRSSDGRICLYKNGLLDAVATNGVGKTLRHHTTFPARLGEWGKDNRPNSHWRGMIDEAQIFTRALASNEVAAIVAAGPEGLCRLTLPDLAVRNISAPGSAALGQPIQLTFVITNAGSALATGAWANTFLLSANSNGAGAETIGSLSFTGAIPANAFVTRTQSVILPGHAFGTRYLGVTVDSGNAISEMVETNNTSFAAVSISIAAPELVIEATNAPASAFFGDAVTVSWSVANRGGAAANAAWADQVYLSAVSNSLSGATLLANVPAGALAANATYARTQAVTLPLVAGRPAGTYFLIVVADANGAQTEGDEANNSAVLPIDLSYPPLPDLAVHKVVAPAFALAGLSAEFSWVITNRGNLAVTGVWSEVVSLSNALGHVQALGELRFTNALVPGASIMRTQSVNVPLHVTAGSWTALVSADTRSEVFEQSEANNTTLATNLSEVPAELKLVSAIREVVEGAAPFSVVVSRNGDRTLALEVTITNSHPGELAMTNRVTIPAGQASATFEVRALLDGIVDGNQFVTFGVAAAEYRGAATSVTVKDVDVPRLTLTFDPASIVEGLTAAATITRDHDTNRALTVVFNADDPSQLTVPTSIVIPSNELSVTFAVLAVDDTIVESARSFSVSATAPGFTSANAALTIHDNDLPAVNLQVLAESVSEGAGPQATTVTIVRSPVTARSLTVDLSSSDTSAVAVPSSVTIPGGRASATVPLAVIDNTSVDGNRTVTVRVHVREAAGNIVAEGTPDSVVVLDDDGPTLKVTIARDLVAEGASPATFATITRNTATGSALSVSLASSDTSELTVASSAVIPAGASSTTVDLVTPIDGVTDGNQIVTVTAAADGFTSGSDLVVVSDIDLPDLVVTSVSSPTNGQTDANFAVNYRIENRGIAANSASFLTRVLLSSDALIGNDTVLGELASDGTLAVGQFIEQSAQFRAPNVPGTYWIIVVADAAARVSEGLEDNNTAFAARPIQIAPAYSATVSTTVETAIAGTPVPLNGVALRADGSPATDVPVNLHVMLRGTKRLFPVRTDANGTFSTVFTPLPGEAGQYSVAATHPGIEFATAQDQFTLLGVRIDPISTRVRVTEGGSITGSVQVVNLGETALSGLNATVVSAPENLGVSVSLEGTSLDGLGALRLHYDIAANNATIPVGDVTLRVTTAEGASADAVLHVLVDSLRPRLVATPEALYASMLRGKQTVVDFELVNAGGAASGPLTISVPNLPWLAVGSVNPLPSLAPNSTNRVTLLLTPGDTLPLGPYSGGIVISDGTSASVTVPFEFRAMAEAKGDLLVSAVDEFTYYAAGAPKVTNAAVIVRDAFSRNVVTNGVTDASGTALFPQLMEGHYEVEVSADKHSTFVGTMYLSGGKTNEFETFLSRQTVSYRWTVVPTLIEDRTEVRIETVFETFVPAPVVTIEPALIDLGGFNGAQTQINLTIQNHGLVTAQDFELNFPEHPLYTFTPLVGDLGGILAGARIEVPVLVQRRPAAALAKSAKNGGGACSISAGGCWELPCGPRRNQYCASVSIVNIGCPPPVYIPGGGGSGSGTAPFFYVPPPNGGGGWSYSTPNVGHGTPPFTPPRTFEPPQICDCEKDNFEEKCLDVPLNSSVLSAAVDAVANALSSIPNLEVEAKAEASVKMCTCCDDDGMGFKVSGGGTVTFEGKLSFPLAGAKVGKSFQQHGYDIDVEATLGCPYEQGVTLAASVNGKTDCHLKNPEVCGSISLDLPASIPCAIGVEVTLKQNGEVKFEQAFEINATLSWGLSGAFEYCRDGNGSRTSGEICGKGLKVEAGLQFTALGQDFNPKLEATIVEENCFQFGGSSAAGKAIRDAAEKKFQDSLRNTKTFIQARKMATVAALGQKAAAAEEGGVCAKVTLQIGQDVVLARNAFDATLQLENSSPGSALEDISVSVFVVDENGQTVTERFGIRPPMVLGLSGVDGSGMLGANATGTASWILVPTSEAAPQVPTRYGVGGVLSYRQDGQQVSVPLFPAPITVYPDPRLHVKYFHQRDVYADDPFTRDVVEPSIPFNLGVMVENRGYGTARNVRIISGQPQIVENEKGLLIDFKIVGTEVAGQAQTPSLTANFGEIAPRTNGVARWLLTSTLQGLFLDYSATFEHIDSFGKTNLSLIDEVTIHEMIRLVQAQGALEDGRPDFLVNDIADPNDLPDRVYLSDGTTNRVEVITSATPDRVPDEGNRVVNLTATVPGGFVYLRVPEPSGGALRLARVVRADGRELYLNTNAWTTDRTFIGRGQRPVSEHILHLFDHDSSGAWTVYYDAPPAADTTAPVSSVAALPLSSYSQISVMWSGSDADGSGIAGYDIFVSDNGGSFTPWLQGTLASGSVFFGEQGRSYAFYSVAVDQAGNREVAPATPDALTLVDRENSAPTISAPANVTINEGSTLSLTTIANDVDAEQSLTFSLGSGAPAGVLVNSANGQVTWPTSEGTGPSTNALRIIVADNGVPSLSATAIVTVVVAEVNIPPALAPLAQRTVSELQALNIPVVASDPDLPVQSLAYSLANAPMGASISSAGVFSWAPTENQGPSTNHIRIIVTDNGPPALSATQTLVVIVRDSRPDFVVRLGSTNLLGGESAHVPVQLQSGLDLTNVSFILDLSAPALTNLALAPASASVGQATLSPVGPQQFQLRLAAATGDVLQGFGEFARLGFDTFATGPSAMVRLQPHSVTGVRASGEVITNGGGAQGRVIVLNAEPVLAPVQRLPRIIEIFARPGMSYTVEYSSTLEGPWLPLETLISPVGQRSVINVEGTGEVIFFRTAPANP